MFRFVLFCFIFIRLSSLHKNSFAVRIYLSLFRTLKNSNIQNLTFATKPYDFPKKQSALHHILQTGSQGICNQFEFNSGALETDTSWKRPHIETIKMWKESAQMWDEVRKKSNRKKAKNNRVQEKDWMHAQCSFNANIRCQMLPYVIHIMYAQVLLWWAFLLNKHSNVYI